MKIKQERLPDKQSEHLLTYRWEIKWVWKTADKICGVLTSECDGLQVYVEHSPAAIDNILIENAIRPAVFGRINWLFISKKASRHSVEV